MSRAFLISLATLFLLVPNSLFAQEEEEEVGIEIDNDTPAIAEADSVVAPSAVHYQDMLPSVACADSNFIRLPGGMSSEMYRFVDKMDSVLLFGKGRVSILHIGGSHVQADMYTNVVRCRLDSLNNGLRPSRGLIFPFRVAKTNNPSNYTVSYGGEWDKARCAVYKPRPALGVSGISVFTNDTSAWIRVCLDPNKSGRWQTQRLRLLGRTERGQLTPVFVTTKGKKIMPKREGRDYIFNLPEMTDTLTISVRPSSRNAQIAEDVFYLDALLPENDEDGIVYHTIGVNGAAVPSYLGCEFFEEQLADLRPDLVIMGIGINDASGPHFSDSTFIANYDSLIRVMRRVSPECALLFMTNNDSSRRKSRRRRIVNTNGPIVQQAFYTLAEKWQGGLYDLFEIMGGLGSMQQWQKAGLAQKDRVHFTRTGYSILGNMFYDAFLEFYLSQEPVDEYAEDY